MCGVTFVSSEFLFVLILFLMDPNVAKKIWLKNIIRIIVILLLVFLFEHIYIVVFGSYEKIHHLYTSDLDFFFDSFCKYFEMFILLKKRTLFGMIYVIVFFYHEN